MVDIVDGTLAILQSDQVFDDLKDIPPPQGRLLIFQNLPNPPLNIIGDRPILQGGHQPDRMKDLGQALNLIGHLWSGEGFVKIEPSFQDSIDKLLPSCLGRSSSQRLFPPSL